MEFECQLTTEVSKNLCDSVDNSYRRKTESNQFNSSPEAENFGISEQPLDSNTEKGKTSIQKPTPTKKPNSDICGSKQFFSSDVVPHSRRTITDLPPALLSEILNFLDPKELGIVSCVSAYLCKLASEHHVWKDFYCERWGTSTLPTPLGAGVSDETSWKEFFVEREFRSKTFMGRYSIDVMYGHTEAVRTVFLLVSAKLIFTAGYDQTVKMWKMEEGLLIASSRSLGCTMRAVAGDTKLLVAGGTDGFIQCWRAVEGFPHLFDIKGSQSQNAEFRLWDHEGPITSLALDLTRIYSGSWDMTVRVWDRFSLKCVKVLRHSDWVWELVPRDLTIASASGSDVYIWDTSSGRLRHKHSTDHLLPRRLLLPNRIQSHPRSHHPLSVPPIASHPIPSHSMDPNPSKFPMLSYVMSRLPSLGPGPSKPAPATPPDLCEIRIDAQPSDQPPILNQMPHLSDPKVLAAMQRAVSDVSQTRSVLKILGDRPDHELVDTAKARLAEIDSVLAKKLEELVLSPRPPDFDRLQWRVHLADKEAQFREQADKDKQGYKAIVQLDELHSAYDKLLKDAEQRLVKIYESAMAGVVEIQEEEPGGDEGLTNGQVPEEVAGILQEASGTTLDRVNLSGRQLQFLPEAFGSIRGLLLLDLSRNELKVLPESIGGLEKLEELNVSSNFLESLPESIGRLQNLKVLNATGNKLSALPDSICQCRSLVELDVSFNGLTYLPTNIGYELANLQKLSIQLNKIRSLPTSVCELRSLRCLDAHFNELRGLPLDFGRLTNLEILSLASNFTDLTELPETFGDLTNLKELDISNNQIHALPDTFGRLENLTKLNVDGNPLVIPPPDIVQQGVEAIKIFMGKRWLEILVEEERKSMLQVQEREEAGWLTRSTSWLKDYVSGVSEYLGSPRTPRDPDLDQQL